MSVPPRTDPLPVVVVGAGLAGLAAAARLVRGGLPVVVLEAGPGPGGRARTTEHDGHLLNLGAHALALRGPGTAVLRDLGVALPGRTPRLTATRLVVDGRPVHPLARRDGGAGTRLLPTLARLPAAAARAPADASVAEVLDEVAGDERVRRDLAAVVRLTTYADAFEVQSAQVLAEQLRGGTVRYLDGGWGAVVGRLRTLVLDGGGVLRTGARATRVLVDGHAAAGIALTDGTTIPAAAVVLAAGGPGDAAALLDGDAGRPLADRAARVRSGRMVALDVALHRRPPLPPVLLGADEPTYVAVHSDRARLAPEGGAVVHLARFLPADGAAPDDAHDRLEQLLEQLAPGWRHHTVHVRRLAGMEVTHDVGLVASGGTAGRPGPRVPGVAGLLVAGDWVGPRGHLAQAALASAAAAADLAASYAADAQQRRRSTVGGP